MGSDTNRPDNKEEKPAGRVETLASSRLARYFGAALAVSAG